MTPVRLEPAASLSRIRHSTTELPIVPLLNFHGKFFLSMTCVVVMRCAIDEQSCNEMCYKRTKVVIRCAIKGKSYSKACYIGTSVY